MNERIRNAGIQISGVFISMGEGYGYWTLDGKVPGAYLTFNGKTIERPSYNDCEKVILKEFGLNI